MAASPSHRNELTFMLHFQQGLSPFLIIMINGQVISAPYMHYFEALHNFTINKPPKPDSGQISQNDLNPPLFRLNSVVYSPGT
jgi:hypothetical protein